MRDAPRRRPRILHRACAAAALFASAAAAAQGDDRPPEAPTRDVAVTYRMVGAAVPEGMEMRVSWLAAEGLARVDSAGGTWTVMSPKNAAAGFMVVEPARVVMPMPAGAVALPGGPEGAGARLVRAGAAAYAGQACTVWRYETEQQRDGETCVTADGVVLRAVSTRKGERAGMEATRVEYGPQDPARFRPPPGYQVVQPPPVATPDAGAPKD